SIEPQMAELRFCYKSVTASGGPNRTSPVMNVFSTGHRTVTKGCVQTGMRCDLHVHTVHSGQCAIPVIKKFCRESYNDPQQTYDLLKSRGMNLVTITDHDSIGAAETLRKHPDCFLSEEVSCLTPDGARLHVGVYDIQERDHIELQRRREDLLSMIFYLQERRLLFSVNHVFSALTGRRTTSDFVLFE